MAVKLNTYLNFRDQTKEAMEYYHSIFGGKLNMQTYKEGGASDDLSEADLIMHASLEAKEGFELMAADTANRMELKQGNNFSLSLIGSDEALLGDYFAKLGKGGTVTMPFEKAPWGDRFGMVVDKFGIAWMVNVSPK